MPPGLPRRERLAVKRPTPAPRSNRRCASRWRGRAMQVWQGIVPVAALKLKRGHAAHSNSPSLETCCRPGLGQSRCGLCEGMAGWV